MAKATSYEFSRRFWDYCFANPEKVKPNHIAVYFFAVEHCNRLGWKEKFGLPTEMVKDAVGIKSWHTYISAFNDLVDWGFFFLVERSKNQYSSNIIALIKNDEALDEALDKAITKHVSKQHQSTYQSIDSIDKQIQKPIINTKPLPLKGKEHFESVHKLFSASYESHTQDFKSQNTKQEYEQFQKFINALFANFEMDKLTSNFDKCLSIGDWKKILNSKGFMILKPAIEKAIAGKEGNREQMALRIKTFSNGLFDEKVFSK